ncbi:MAG: tetratricopeptide repeat protein [Promethearchaeota archaeon]
MAGLGNKSITKNKITNLIDQGKLEEALRELNNVEEKEKTLLMFKLLRISILTKTGRYHIALREALELYFTYIKNMHLDIILSLADIYWRIGKIREGSEIIKEGEGLIPETIPTESLHLLKKQFYLLNLKSIYASSQGKTLLAIRCLKQNVILSKKINDRKVTADLFDKLGIFYLDIKQLNLALRFFRSSLFIYREINSRHNISWLLYRMGWAYLIDETNLDLALCYFDLSQKISTIIDDKYSLASSLFWSADILKTRNDIVQALKLFQRSLTLYEQIQNMKGMGLCLEKISQIYETKNNSEMANQYFQKSLAAWRIAYQLYGIHIRL